MISIGVQWRNCGSEFEGVGLVFLGREILFKGLSIDNEEIVGHIHSEQIRTPFGSFVQGDFITKAWLFLPSKSTDSSGQSSTDMGDTNTLGTY